MRELTKGEKKQVKELLRKGILRRHAQWQSELRELLDRYRRLMRPNER